MSGYRRLAAGKRLISSLQAGAVAERGQQRVIPGVGGQVMRLAGLDGRAGDRRTGRIARHLARCLGCGLEARAYSEIKSALARGDRSAAGAAVRRLTDFGASLVAGPGGDLFP